MTFRPRLFSPAWGSSAGVLVFALAVGLGVAAPAAADEFQLGDDDDSSGDGLGGFGLPEGGDFPIRDDGREDGEKKGSQEVPITGASSSRKDLENIAVPVDELPSGMQPAVQDEVQGREAEVLGDDAGDGAETRRRNQPVEVTEDGERRSAEDRTGYRVSKRTGRDFSHDGQVKVSVHGGFALLQSPSVQLTGRVSYAPRSRWDFGAVFRAQVISGQEILSVPGGPAVYRSAWGEEYVFIITAAGRYLPISRGSHKLWLGVELGVSYINRFAPRALGTPFDPTARERKVSIGAAVSPSYQYDFSEFAGVVLTAEFLLRDLNLGFSVTGGIEARFP